MNAHSSFIPGKNLIQTEKVLKDYVSQRRIARMDSLSDVEEELLRRRSVRWFPSAEMLLSQASVAAEKEAEEQQRTLALALTAKANVELGFKRMNCEEAIHVLRTSIIEEFGVSKLERIAPKNSR
ncbi:hypothetical protein IEQ34_006892 [Dendrobium chrysotoxum]|uniref:Uncharacterized protein n=1 Tax=Dendrobium chrysotoxum TaxID=161865 RepID=A0AAV7H6E0_DENCH|nr:hypothetical protein IEQ34_006892 [Dendrobium chrysotoxum]